MSLWGDDGLELFGIQIGNALQLQRVEVRHRTCLQADQLDSISVRRGVLRHPDTTELTPDDEAVTHFYSLADPIHPSLDPLTSLRYSGQLAPANQILRSRPAQNSSRNRRRCSLPASVRWRVSRNW